MFFMGTQYLSMPKINLFFYTLIIYSDIKTMQLVAHWNVTDLTTSVASGSCLQRSWVQIPGRTTHIHYISRNLLSNNPESGGWRKLFRVSESTLSRCFYAWFLTDRDRLLPHQTMRVWEPSCSSSWLMEEGILERETAQALGYTLSKALRNTR